MPTVNVPNWLSPPSLRSAFDRVVVLAIVGAAWFAATRQQPAPVIHVEPAPAPAPADPSPPPTPAPAPTPPPLVTPPLVLVAKEYDATLAATFASIGDRVAGGELADKGAIVAAFGEHSSPMGQTLAAAIDGACAANGSVSDKAGLGGLFKQVGAALQAK